MPAISAVDAISPAIQRTRDFLFRPFRWSTYLKLCLVAMFTEGLGGNFNFSWPGGRSSSHPHLSNSPSFHLSHGWIVVIVAVSVVFIALCFFLAYLITRLRFAYFHCLIHNIKEIRPGWRLYRTQAIRFFWLHIVVGLCFLLLMALIALPFVAGFLRLIHITRADGHPSTGSILLLFLPLIPTVLLIVILGIATEIILRDWMLPHFALENATASQAWAAVREHIRTEKAPFFVYALLRVALRVVASIAFVIAVAVLALILVAVIAIAWLGLHLTVSGTIVGRLVVTLMLVASFAAIFFFSVCLIGPVGTALREYALVFYGGRYQRLGEILFPPPAAGTGEPGTA